MVDGIYLVGIFLALEFYSMESGYWVARIMGMGAAICSSTNLDSRAL